MEIKNEVLLQKTALSSQKRWISGDLPVSPEQSLILGELWLTFWKRKVVIASFAGALFLLVAMYTFLTKPVYESVAEIHVDPSQQGSLGLEQLITQQLSFGDFDSRLQTQVKILQSDTVSMQVIKDLDLAHNEAFGGKKLAGKIAETDPLTMRPKDREVLLQIFQNNEDVTVIPKTQMIRISFRSTDPKLAAGVVNAILDAHLLNNFQMRYQGTQQVSQWLSKQLEELKTNAAEAQRKLADFQKENNILGTSENSNIVTDRLGQLNQQVTEAEADRIMKEARYRLASTGNPELVASVVPSTTLQVLRTQEANLKTQSAQLDAKFGSGYPRVRELEDQLMRLDKAIADEVQNVGQRLHDEFLAAAKSEDLLRGRFEEQKQEAFKLNESAVQFATLKHEVDSSQTLYDSLQLKLKEAGVAAGLASADISIVDRGQISATPVSPKKLLNLVLGLFGGLFGGLVLAFLLESLDDTLETSADVEAASSLPVLAVIPSGVARGRFHTGSRRQLRAPGLATVSIQRPNSAMAEAYRAACSSLLLSSVDTAARILVVTSASPQEGKSVTSCNLAIALARRGGKVLLIDGDLRRSSIHAQFGITTTEGLTSMLAGKSGQEAIKNPLTELPNLAILPAGPHPPSPAEMLASNRLEFFLKKWAEEYDHVIFDTAPMIPVADTFALAARADAVILVVRSGVTRNKALTRVRDLLYRTNAHIAGVVVNAANMQMDHYYYGYNSAYGSYYGEIKEDTSGRN